MDTIKFEKFDSTFTILNPFNDFAEEQHHVEVRKDPLLGDTSVYNPYLRDKAKAFFGQNDPELLRKLVEESAANCIFCGDNVRRKTACYPESQLSGGRLVEGDAILFANLFSVGAHHPVIALTKAHFLRPSEFGPRLLADGFRAAKLFLRDVYQRDVTIAFSTLNANYLLPAGASLVHPHLQLLATAVPYTYHGRLLSAAAEYTMRNGTSYFDDLVAREASLGERYIARQGEWHWLASFSPLGSNEIMGIHDSMSDLGQLMERDLRDLCDGVAKVLAFFESLDHLSFNFTLYSARGAETVGSRCVIKLVTRQNLYPNYRNDDYFLQKMLQTELIFNLPEELARQAQTHFNSGGTQ